MKKSEKPGVMLYFDIRPCLNRLTDSEQAQLFRAILDYGESSIEPGFEDRLGLVWDFVKPMIDRDTDRYKEIQEKRARAGSRGGQAKASNAKQSEANLANATFAKDDVAKESKDSTTKQIKPTTTTATATTTATTTEDIYQPGTNNQPGTYNGDCCMGALNGPTTTRQRFKPPTVDEVKDYITEKGYTIDPETFVDYYTANGWKIGKSSMKDWRAAVRTWNRKEQANGRNSNSNGNNRVSESPPIKLKPQYVL